MPIIDTHQHLWDLKALSLNWVKGDKILDQSYLMSDYLEASKGTGIEQTVYMEVNVNPLCVEDEIQQMSAHCVASETPMKKMVIAGNPSSLDFKIKNLESIIEHEIPFFSIFENEDFEDLKSIVEDYESRQ